MRSIVRWPVALTLVAMFILMLRAHTDRDVAVAQSRKPVVVTRLYTGPDGQTHAEQIEVTLTGDRLNEVSEMFKVTGAEIHRAPAGKVNDCTIRRAVSSRSRSAAEGKWKWRAV